jgi:chromosome segregation ATPase
MLGPLTLPPKLAKQAIEDLHTVALALRELAHDEGDLASLAHGVSELPRVEDELSEQIRQLREEVRGMRVWLEPLHKELTDLDDTAESLERSLALVSESIAALQGLLKKLPGV